MSLAKLLGSSGRNLVRDRRAFRRWFAYDAVSSRLEKQICNFEYQICFLLERIGHIVSGVMTKENETGLPEPFWRKPIFDEIFSPLMAYQGDSRVRIGAYRCLHSVVAVMSSLTESDALGPQSLRFIYRPSLETSENIWVKVEALKSLRLIDSDGYKTALKRIFEQPVGGEQIFLRRAVLSLEASAVDTVEQLEGIIGIGD